jgi:hypothetical protein
MTDELKKTIKFAEEMRSTFSRKCDNYIHWDGYVQGLKGARNLFYEEEKKHEQKLQMVRKENRRDVQQDCPTISIVIGRIL